MTAAAPAEASSNGPTAACWLRRGVVGSASYDPVGAFPLQEPNEAVNDRAKPDAVDTRAEAEGLGPRPAEPDASLETRASAGTEQDDAVPPDGAELSSHTKVDREQPERPEEHEAALQDQVDISAEDAEAETEARCAQDERHGARSPRNMRLSRWARASAPSRNRGPKRRLVEPSASTRLSPTPGTHLAQPMRRSSTVTSLSYERAAIARIVLPPMRRGGSCVPASGPLRSTPALPSRLPPSQGQAI